MKPGLQQTRKQGGVPVPCKPGCSLQSAPKSHQLRNGLNNLGWGTMPAIWICLSMSKENTQLKYLSADHFLVFSPSCCSKPPLKFSFKKLCAAKLKLMRLLEEIKLFPFQPQHLEAQTALWEFSVHLLPKKICWGQQPFPPAQLATEMVGVHLRCFNEGHFSSHYRWNGFTWRGLTPKRKGWATYCCPLTCQSSSDGASRPRHAKSVGH